MLNDCIRWCVGNGSSIRVAGQPWLRDGAIGVVNHCDSFPLNNMHVSDLISPIITRWNVLILHSFFGPHDVVEILKVLLQNISDKDRLIWKYNKD